MDRVCLYGGRKSREWGRTEKRMRTEKAEAINTKVSIAVLRLLILVL